MNSSQIYGQAVYISQSQFPLQTLSQNKPWETVCEDYTVTAFKEFGVCKGKRFPRQCLRFASAPTFYDLSWEAFQGLASSQTKNVNKGNHCTQQFSSKCLPLQWQPPLLSQWKILKHVVGHRGLEHQLQEGNIETNSGASSKQVLLQRVV